MKFRNKVLAVSVFAAMVVPGAAMADSDPVGRALHGLFNGNGSGINWDHRGSPHIRHAWNDDDDNGRRGRGWARHDDDDNGRRGRGFSRHDRDDKGRKGGRGWSRNDDDDNRGRRGRNDDDD